MIPRVSSERKLAGRLVLLARRRIPWRLLVLRRPWRVAKHKLPLSVARARGKTRRTASFADTAEKLKPAGDQEMMDIDDENGAGDGRGAADDFFRCFSIPGGKIPDRTRGERLTIGQGSGFFIWADGYAVTNAHMVDTAEGAEIMTQDRKICIARVIGTGPEDRPRPHQGRPACRFSLCQTRRRLIARGRPNLSVSDRRS